MLSDRRNTGTNVPERLAKWLRALEIWTPGAPCSKIAENYEKIAKRAEAKAAGIVLHQTGG